MAERVVSILIERLAALIEQRVSLLQGVSAEVIAIKNELQIIRAFLRDADSKSQTDEGVKEWVNQVREVAQEIETVLDDPDAEIQGSCIGAAKDFIAGVAYFFICVKSDKRIVTQIKAIKARIEWLSDCRQRYNLSNSEQQTSTSYWVGTTMRDPREDALFLGESQVVGIAGPRDTLIAFLSEADPRLRVVSVYGMGGLGKTTLAKKVYDSQAMIYGFPDYRAWITVSQSFDPYSLLKSVLKQLFGEIEGLDKMEAMEMKQTLYNKLLGKRYVVVLDDIWNSHAWKGFKNALPVDDSGSRIIVTTRFENIAAETCIDSHGLMYKLEPLNLEDSWKLFHKKAFRLNAENVTFDPEKFPSDPCSNFLNKCKGLPLGIVAIGGLLSTKPPGEWDQVYQTLGSLMDGSRGSALEDLRQVISYSYTDLPYHLRSCFLYMSIFPEDYSIQSSRLLRLWAAEGFVEAERRPGMNLTKEEIANSYLEELIQRSLVQVEATNVYGKVSRCNVHDLIREFIIDVAINENFAAFIIEEQEAPRSSRQPPPRLSYGTELSGESSESDFLRSLFLFQGIQSSFKFSIFRLLKVLDVDHVYTSNENFPSEMGNLANLRYLRLRSYGNQASVSFGKLVNLETLDLKYSFVGDCDFSGIVNMTHLRNLMLGSHSDFPGVKLPIGISKLTSLEKLGVLDLDEEGNGLFIKELGNMTRLRKLSVRGLREEDEMQLFASVGKMKLLRSFKVSSNFQHSGSLSSPPPSLRSLHSGSLSSPPPSLRSLFIEGSLNPLPPWISSLPNLKKLVLSKSSLEGNPMEALEQLPNLVILTLNQAFRGEKLSISNGGFPKLEKLELAYLRSLTEVRVNPGGMPVIQSIAFKACKRQRSVLPLRMDYRPNMPEIINL